MLNYSVAELRFKIKTWGTSDGIAGNGGAKGDKGVKALFTLLPFYL